MTCAMRSHRYARVEVTPACPRRPFRPRQRATAKTTRQNAGACGSDSSTSALSICAEMQADHGAPVQARPGRFFAACSPWPHLAPAPPRHQTKLRQPLRFLNRQSRCPAQGVGRGPGAIQQNPGLFVYFAPLTRGGVNQGEGRTRSSIRPPPRSTRVLHIPRLRPYGGRGSAAPWPDVTRMQSAIPKHLLNTLPRQASRLADRLERFSALTR